MDFKETRKVLNEYGQMTVERAQFELTITRTIRGRKVNRVATGTLKENLMYQVHKRKEKFSVLFGADGPANVYARFIHEGVNGTKVNVGSPYSFKSKFVNIGAIKTWMENRKIPLRDYKTGRFIPKTDKNEDQASFMIARSIARKGIAPVPFFTMATEWSYEKMKEKIAQAISKDSIKILTK